MTSDDGCLCVACPKTLSIGQAEEVREALLAALAGGRDVEIDCSAAIEADLSFIQLIVSARLAAARRGVALRLKASADGPVAAALRMGGLDNDGFWAGGCD
jgi:anti-anti-sigma regulatory factor